MSKPLSGHFHGTTGERNYMIVSTDEGDIIKERTKGLDLREHPIQHKTDLPLKTIKRKIADRTATREEFQKKDRLGRLDKKRRIGVDEFWKQERRRIKEGKKTTREWTAEQRDAILHTRKPKVNGKSIQGHHTYSVSLYPHLADKGEIIYPVSFEEHLYYWHGGNFKQSLPGRPFKRTTHR